MGPLGIQETIVIFVLALLVFGPKKLPELGKTIGKAMTEFRRASNELKSTWSREMAAIEQEGESIRAETRKITDEIKSSYNDDAAGSHYDSEYDYEYEDSYDYGAGNTSDSTADDSSNVGASAAQGAESTASADSSVSTPPEGTVPSGSATSTDGTTSSKSDPEVEDVTTPAPGRTSAGSEAVTT